MQVNCAKNGDDCKTCSESNCNSRPLFQTCLHCNSEQDDHCIDNPELAISKVCKSYTDECFSHIGNRTFSRGCLHEKNFKFISDCHRNKNKCQTCNRRTGTGCNTERILMETCIECDSNELGCRYQPKLFKGKICSDFFSSYPEGCYITEVSKTRTYFVDKILVIFENFIGFFFRINTCGEVVFKTWTEDQSISVLYSRTHAKHASGMIVMRGRIFKNATQQMVKLT